MEELLAVPGVKLHLYGKKVSKKLRKLGHITILDKTVNGALSKANAVKSLIKIVPE